MPALVLILLHYITVTLWTQPEITRKLSAGIMTKMMRTGVDFHFIQ